MKGGIETQTGEDPAAPFVINRRGAALSTWDAAECNRVSGQELTGEEERAHADPAGAAEAKA